MYAALSATNEAILRTTSPEELYRRVCDAAVHSGQFVMTAVLIPDSETRRARIVAVTGAGERHLRDAYISVDPATAEGRGAAGTAFRTRAPCVIDDYLNDERTRVWRAKVIEAGIRSGAAVPLMRDGHVTGVLIFYSNETNAFDDDVVNLLQRMADNVSFALANFDREAARKRLSRMVAAQSAANEAILRARSPEDLYQRMCDAVAQSDNFFAVALFLVDADSAWTRLVASTGQGSAELRKVRVSVDESYPEGRGLTGMAFRTQKPHISNDCTNDERTRPWHELAQTLGVNANAVLPVIRGGRSVGVLMIFSGETNAFDEETIKLLEQLSENITFALDNYDRENERKHSETALLRFREALNASADSIAIVEGAARRIVDINESSCRNLGYSRDELIGKDVSTLIVGRTEEQTQADYRRLDTGVETSQLLRAFHRHKNGTLIPIEVTRRLLKTDEGTWVVAIARDITERLEAEEALRASEEKYRGILENMFEGYFELDFDGKLVFFNDALCRISNRTREQLMGLSYRDYTDPQTAKRLYKAYRELHRTGQPLQLTYEAVSPTTGKTTIFETSAHLITDADGKPTGFRGVLRDVTGRHQAEEALRESEARFRALTELSSDWYWEWDREFRFARLENRRGDKDDAKARLLGKRAWDTGYNIDYEGGWDAYRALLASHRSFRDVVMYAVLPNGKPRYISLSGAAIFDNNGDFAGYRGVTREITQQKLAEERIQYLATHDALTGLPNRMMFSQLLNAAILSARRYQRHFAVLFIDLDRFKIINDTLGHETGDKLLQETAARLQQTLRASDVIARLGGDEFVVLVHEVGEPAQVTAIARKILSAIIRPMDLLGQECRVTASIGVCLYPSDALEEQSLMKNADMAMYLAKEEGKNNFQFYSKRIKAQSLERLALETNLRRALEREEFALHYQAKLDVRSGAITGVEALLRWQSAELGAVSPAQFIPIAEETGLIVPIGKWVLQTACAQNAAWQRDGLPSVRMAVNLSARQFTDENLLDDIAAALKNSGMAPELLELEITEGMVMHNAERAAELFRAIKDLGVRLAIDDFGTGYSSLAQIKRFPIDTLKIDRSFIREIPRDLEDRAITEAILAMAKTLCLTVVAEGVETEEQAQFLRDRGCDELQGYYCSKPIVAGEFAELLRQRTAALPT